MTSRPSPPGSGDAMSPTAGHRALVVDDELAFAGLVSNYLRTAGFEVTQAFDGLSALTVAQAFDPDLVILDLGPAGLAVGADGYLTKPFSPREFVARAQVMLRRPRARSQDHQPRTVGALLVDPDGHEIRVAVWGTNWVGDEHLVDVHIRNLRRRPGDDAANPRFIRTVRGVGYRMGEAM